MVGLIACQGSSNDVAETRPGCHRYWPLLVVPQLGSHEQTPAVDPEGQSRAESTQLELQDLAVGDSGDWHLFTHELRPRRGDLMGREEAMSLLEESDSGLISENQSSHHSRRLGQGLRCSWRVGSVVDALLLVVLGNRHLICVAGLPGWGAAALSTGGQINCEAAIELQSADVHHCFHSMLRVAPAFGRRTLRDLGGPGSHDGQISQP